MNVTLTNPGALPVTVTPASGNPAFQVSTQPIQIAAGASAQASISFTPAIVGAVRSSATFDAGNGQPASVTLTGTGITPSVTVSPATLDFGNVALRASAVLNVTLTNPGPLATTVTAATGDPAFQVPTQPIQIAAGASAQVPIRFAPGTVGAVRSTATFDVGNGQPASVALTGTGVAPSVTVLPATLDFGNVAVRASAVLNVTLTNPGSLAVTVTPATSNPVFQISTQPIQIAAGASAQASITFTPTAAGAVRSTATFDAGNGQPLSVALSGTGVSSPFTVSPTTVDFGSVPLGTSSTQSVVVSNATSSVAQIALSISDPAFQASGKTIAVPAGASVSVPIVFTPASVGTVHATATFALGGVSIPVSLAGAGVTGTLTVSPSSIDFGAVPVGSPSTRTLTVTNSGAAAVMVQASSNNNAFAFQPATVQVASGASAAIAVSLTPAQVGTVNGTVSLAVTPGSPVTVSATATAVSGSLAYAVTDTGGSRSLSDGGAIDLGAVDLGSSGTASLNLRNTGSNAVPVTSISSSGAGFSISGATFPLTIAPGAVLTLTIAFQPTAPGSVAGKVTIDGRDTFVLAASGRIPTLPAVAINGVPGAVGSSEQSAITFTLGAPYPVDIDGVIAVAFRPNAVFNCSNSPAQFENAATTANFRIPAGATRAVFALDSAPSKLGVQFGNVAGDVSLKATLSVAGTDITPDPAPSAATTVRGQEPRISNVDIAARSDSGFDLVVTGDSTLREVSQATFLFQPAAGQTLGTGTVTVPVADAFRAWYSSPDSCVFGGSFQMTQRFELQGAISAIGEVSVTLTNGAGQSAVKGARF
jgi:hypothetical protein